MGVKSLILMSTGVRWEHQGAVGSEANASARAPLGEDAAFLGSRGFIGMWEDGSGLVTTSGFLKEARNLGFYVTFLGVLRPFIQALPKGYREQIIHICGLGFSPWQSVDSLGGKTVRERSGAAPLGRVESQGARSGQRHRR